MRSIQKSIPKKKNLPQKSPKKVSKKSAKKCAKKCPKKVPKKVAKSGRVRLLALTQSICRKLKSIYTIVSLRVYVRKSIIKESTRDGVNGLIWEGVRAFELLIATQMAIILNGLKLCQNINGIIRFPTASCVEPPKYLSWEENVSGKN